MEHRHSVICMSPQKKKPFQVLKRFDMHSSFSSSLFFFSADDEHENVCECVLNVECRVYSTNSYFPVVLDAAVAVVVVVVTFSEIVSSNVDRVYQIGYE